MCVRDKLYCVMKFFFIGPQWELSTWYHNRSRSVSPDTIWVLPIRPRWHTGIDLVIGFSMSVYQMWEINHSWKRKKNSKRWLQIFTAIMPIFIKNIYDVLMEEFALKIVLRWSLFAILQKSFIRFIKDVKNLCCNPRAIFCLTC